jgi:tryptophan-rich sensory protein
MRNKLIWPVLGTILCFGWQKLSRIFRWCVNIIFPGSIARYSQLYPILEKSKVAPPQWVYYLGWPLVYLLFGVGFESVRSNHDNAYRSSLLFLCCVQVVLNLIHAFTFFGLGRIFYTSSWLLGTTSLLGIVTTVLCYIANIRTYSGAHKAFWFFMPYSGWLLYSCLIQRDIMRLGLY